MSRLYFDKIMLKHVKEIINDCLDLKKSASEGAFEIVEMFDEIASEKEINKTKEEDNK